MRRGPVNALYSVTWPPDGERATLARLGSRGEALGSSLGLFLLICSASVAIILGTFVGNRWEVEVGLPSYAHLH